MLFKKRIQIIGMKKYLTPVLSLLIISVFLFPGISIAQKKEKRKNQEDKSESKFRRMFIDSTDNALDISKWMTELHGFLPLPSIITEPAVGYGLQLNLVFFHPTKQSIDKNTEHKKQLTLPSMSVAGGVYTQNKTWGAYAGHYGSYKQDKIRIAAAGGWLNININYYLKGPLGKEHELKFNLTGLPLYLSFAHKLGKSKWYAGVDYFFYRNQIKLKTDLDIPLFDSLTGYTQLGGLGMNIYRQNFDNAFTPGKGTMIKFSYRHNDSWLGSDYRYENMKLRFIGYGNWVKNWVMGLRVEGDLILGDYPFYVRPFVSLRGIPVMRYQGDYVLTAETEHRVNITRRWALVGFVGLGIPTDIDEQFTFENSKFAGGGGFRYLLARWFGMYMGIDTAVGPEGWAWYIVMGSRWLGI